MIEDEDPFRGEDGEQPPDLKRGRRKRAGHNVDRLPPHSIEAEQASLGCMIISPDTCMPEAIKLLGIDDSVMYDLRHQTIYAHLMQMHDNTKAIDLITLHQRLADFDLVEQVGGIDYLASLTDITSSANFTYYAEILKEKFILRRMIHACTDAVAKVYSHEGNFDEFMDGVEAAILAIRRDKAAAGAVSIKELAPESLKRLEDMATGNTPTGLSTGFIDYDKMTGGLQNGEMILIAARPSLGKTSLAMNIAEHVAVNLRLPVGVFSLEMTKASLTDRMICSRARVNIRNIRDRLVSMPDAARVTQAAKTLAASPLYIDDASNLSIMELRARARAMVQQYGIKLFVVDYMQLLSSTTRRAKDSRQQEVSEISQGIKSLAKELGVPVVALSQLNRDLEKTSRRPVLSDLRESGSLEQDADIVGLLSKVAYDDEQAAEEADSVLTNWNIAKSRNGPRGDIELLFLKCFTRFESAAKVSDDDVPPTSNQRTYKAPYAETEPLPLQTESD